MSKQVDNPDIKYQSQEDMMAADNDSMLPLRHLLRAVVEDWTDEQDYEDANGAEYFIFSTCMEYEDKDGMTVEFSIVGYCWFDKTNINSYGIDLTIENEWLDIATDLSGASVEKTVDIIVHNGVIERATYDIGYRDDYLNQIERRRIKDSLRQFDVEELLKDLELYIIKHEQNY